MKRILMMLLIIAMAVALSACGTKRDFAGYDDAPHVMSVVDLTTGYTIYRHDTTGVWYICRDGVYGKSICVMVNPDGTPYTEETAP